MQEIIVVVIVLDQMNAVAVKETPIMDMEMEVAVDGYSYQLSYSYVAYVIMDLVADSETADSETSDQEVDLETADQEIMDLVIVDFVMDQTVLLADATRKKIRRRC